MAIALKRTGDSLQQIEVGDSLEADSLERRAGSGNLVVGSGLGAAEELQLGSSTALVRSMGDAQVDGQLVVTDSAGDTNALADLDQTGTNAGRSRVFVGGRDPEGNVTANAGDLYVRDSGGDSIVYIHRGSDGTNTGWRELGLRGIEPNAQTGTTYTLAAADNGKVLTFDNASNITVSCNTGLPANFACLLVQLGAGLVIVAGTATVNNRQSHDRSAGQYAVMSLTQYASDTYVLGGDTAAA